MMKFKDDDHMTTISISVGNEVGARELFTLTSAKEAIGIFFLLDGLKWKRLFYNLKAGLDPSARGQWMVEDE